MLESASYDERDRKHIRKKMRETLYRLFDEKEAQFDKEISELRAKIADLKKLQELRKRERENIVERRLQELLDTVNTAPPGKKKR